jgi:choline dehydrogenase-like flavoprotein
MSDPDVIIVGSGAGGGTLAWGLASAGVNVLVLEKGPKYGLEDFVYHDEIRSSRRDMFVPFASEEPHMVKVGDEPAHRRSTDGWISCVVGGGTVHMSGFFYRLHEVDFRRKSMLGAPAGSSVIDWPIAYADLAPFYDQVEQILGVSGAAGSNPFDAPRSGPYVNPPLQEHAITPHLDRALKKLGWHPFPTPRAVLSRDFDGRPACDYCGYCGGYGCWNGAKSSTLFTFIPRAIATGHCTVQPQAMVTEVVAGDDGKVRGVRWRDAAGATHEERARVVVVSCGAIESARLLLMSRSKRFPQGLANGAGQVGRNLALSTFGSVEAELLSSGGGKNVDGLMSRHPWLGRSIQDFYQPKDGPKGGTIRFDLAHVNPIFNAENVARGGSRVIWGENLKAAMERRFHQGRTLEAEIFGEFTPTPASFVELDPDVKDRFGLPAARITAKHHDDDLTAAARLTARAEEAFHALKADTVHVKQKAGVTWVLQHGTCRFGEDPQQSVLDATCRAHEVPNLYVVDGSFLPTSGGIPNTLTIEANALRVASHLRDRLAQRDL